MLLLYFCLLFFFFFKQKTAYEMRISDWSSDVCSSDLDPPTFVIPEGARERAAPEPTRCSEVCEHPRYVHGPALPAVAGPADCWRSAYCRRRRCRHRGAGHGDSTDQDARGPRGRAGEIGRAHV